MSLTSTVATLVTAETQKLRELPMPAWAYGAFAFASFLMLLGVLWAFRNTASKYDTPGGSGHGDVHGTAGSQGPSGSHGTTDRGAHH